MSEPPTPERPQIGTAAENKEIDNEDEPRIYVASLSDYNAGRLHGTWINANQDQDEIDEDIKQMLAKSKEPIAEEWAIHDYEGFGRLYLSEYESIERVAQIGQGIAELGARPSPTGPTTSAQVSGNTSTASRTTSWARGAQPPSSPSRCSKTWASTSTR